MIQKSKHHAFISQRIDNQAASRFKADADDYRDLPTADVVFITAALGIGFAGFMTCSFLVLKVLNIV